MLVSWGIGTSSSWNLLRNGHSPPDLDSGLLWFRSTWLCWERPGLLQSSLWFFKKNLKVLQSKLVGLVPSCHRLAFLQVRKPAIGLLSREKDHRGQFQKHAWSPAKLRLLLIYTAEKMKDLQCLASTWLGTLEILEFKQRKLRNPTI